MIAGTDTAYKLAKQYRLKTAFGTDTLFDPKLAETAGRTARQAGALVHAVRGAEDGDRRQRRAARAVGPAQPYTGKLGVVEVGALADLLLVDGDPLANIALDRGPGEELRGHHERRRDLQERAREPGRRGTGR